MLSRDEVTVDGVCMASRIYWTLQHTTRNYTSQITITHRQVLCLVTSSSSGPFSACGLTSSQAGGHLTPNSYSSDCRLSGLRILTCSVGPRDAASGRSNRKKNFSCNCDIVVTQPPLRTSQKTPLPTVLLLLCDVTAVAGTHLLCHCLATCLGTKIFRIIFCAKLSGFPEDMISYIDALLEEYLTSLSLQMAQSKLHETATVTTCFREVLCSNLDRKPTILTDVFRVLPQTSHVSARIVL
jgi:hypothetical protein